MAAREAASWVEGVAGEEEKVAAAKEEEERVGGVMVEVAGAGGDWGVAKGEAAKEVAVREAEAMEEVVMVVVKMVANVVVAQEGTAEMLAGGEAGVALGAWVVRVAILGVAAVGLVAEVAGLAVVEVRAPRKRKSIDRSC